VPGSVPPPAKLYGGGRYLEFAHKSAPRKKTAIENSTVIDREFDPLSITVEFFDLRIFSLGALFLGKLLLANLIKATVDLLI
jgi:hypothetical protein